MDYSTIWLDTVKRGAMPLQVRGMGTLIHEQGSANLVARVTVPASLAAGLKPGQNAAIASKNGAVGKGRVANIGPQSNDARTVDIALDAVPQGTTAGLEVNVTIDIGHLDNTLYIGRPVKSAPNSEISLFKISADGSEAIRTTVHLGRASVSTIEVQDGLKEGDKVIISDMSPVANAERIRLTDQNHVTSH